jgi:cell division protein FtsI/penicillin-binding protein 2
MVGSVNVNDASALEARNEVLCGTGFFTNIAQYKCTDIGDISDEGKAKKMNEQELGSMESLLGKMGVEDAVEDIQKEQKQKPGENKKKLVSDEKP